ncbi:MAG: hypothetical protein JWO52_4063 [Gammaproteobacteria bacterium]|nr:hypothetical protein [Gammaproteobacteria bacterium]
MQLQQHSWQWLQNFDLSFDGTFPQGNKTPTLLWNTTLLPVLTGNHAGSVISANVRAALVGDGASLATISLVFVSGTDISGWTAPGAGNTLTNPGTSAGSGVFILRASYLGLTVDATVSWSIIAVVGGGTKYHPGNYFWFDNQFWPGNQQPNYAAHIGSLIADPNVRGIEIIFTWGVMSDPTLTGGKQTHTAVFAIIDSILATLRTATHPVYLVVKHWQTFFNTLSVSNTGDWPQWLINKGNWVRAFIDLGGHQRTQLDYDNDAVWAALTEMYQNLGDRYNNDPNFEMVTLFDESVAVSVTQNAGTVINSDHYNTKYTQMFLDVKPHWSRTAIGVPLNFLPPGGAVEQTAMCTLITTLRQAYPGGFAFGGPDPAIQGVRGIPGDWLTTFQRIVAGVLGTVGDVRGKITLINHIEEYLLGNTGSPPTNPGVTPTQLMTSAVDIYKAQYCFWNYENWEFYKVADELAAIHARNGITAAMPTEGTFDTTPGTHS